MGPKETGEPVQDLHEKGPRIFANGFHTLSLYDEVSVCRKRRYSQVNNNPGTVRRNSGHSPLTKSAPAASFHRTHDALRCEHIPQGVFVL